MRPNRRDLVSLQQLCEPSLTVISTVGEIIQEAVELVGHVGVVERGGVRVVPQDGGRVAVAETGLGLKQQPLIHKVGGHAVAQAVQPRMFDTRGPPEAGEPMGESAGGEVGRPSRRRAEQPVLLRLRSGCPGAEMAADHVRRARPEGHPPGPARLGGAEDARGQAPLDGQDPVVQV